jgi:surface polysaccharide O-acyltransferase-like enzyme
VSHASPATAPAGAATPRIMSVDVVRVLAIVFVIVIHAAPFTHGTPPVRVGLGWSAATIANQLARFAVPCFLVLSGFFWGRRADTPARLVETTRRMLPRLLVLFVGWSLVFALPFEADRLFRDVPHGFLDALQRNVRWIRTHPGTVLLQGTQTHLWFLSSLIGCVTISALWLRRWPLWPLGAIAAALFIASLLAGPYIKSSLGFRVPFNPRNGPGFALLFFVIGAALARRAPQTVWATYGAALLLAGVLLSAAELSFLRTHHGRSLAQDFVVGTLPTGVGAALLALSDHPWLRRPRLAALGPSVLGIYAVHPVFIDLLGPWFARRHAGWADLAEIALVFGLSLCTVRLLARGRVTRLLVT